MRHFGNRSLHLGIMGMVFAAAVALPRAASATTTITGGNVGNQTWMPADGPFIIQGDITVQTGATLTIYGGTVVRFASTDMQNSGTPRVELIVNGTLAVNGNSNGPVIFEAQAGTAAGDAEAFRPLVVRYQRQAFSVSLRMLGSRSDAEDVVQQAFVDAFNALDRFRDEGRAHAFSTWLLRIVVNRSKDVLKSKRHTEQSLDHDVSAQDAAFAYSPGDPESNAAGGQRRQRLEAALLAVPAKYREVLVLKDVEDLSYEEIRAILRLPITTLKMRVIRARAMLRDLLEQTEGRSP